MAIILRHLPYYIEIFKIDDFLKDPTLVFGFQDWSVKPSITFVSEIIRRIELWLQYRLIIREGLQTPNTIRGKIINPQTTSDVLKFKNKNFQQILELKGLKSVLTLDLFDDRANIIHDMNYPISSEYKNCFNTIYDIGNIEHIFDTKQCLINLFQMLKVNGHILIHTPCAGYFNHGFYTFGPECIIKVLESNGFLIKYMKFSTRDGFEIDNPAMVTNSLLWVVAQKKQDLDNFNIPNQMIWNDFYKTRNKYKV